MPKVLTVGELIEKLKEFDPSLQVCTEGCDCIGDVASVSFAPPSEYFKEGYVLIERPA